MTAPVTVSLSRLSRARAVLADPAPGRPGVLTTDRHPAYDRLPSDQRQVCWAPLRRDARAMIDRRAAGAATATDGLGHADILLLQWQRVRDGTPTRRGFRPPDLGWVRPGILAPPGRGAGCGRGTTAGVCRERLAAEPASYTFAAAEGVGPTNDAAGRAPRHAVWWRRTSYGTDSAGGRRFVERVLTAVATGRRQGRDVLDLSTGRGRAAAACVAPPSLLPRPRPRPLPDRPTLLPR